MLIANQSGICELRWQVVLKCQSPYLFPRLLHPEFRSTKCKPLCLWLLLLLLSVNLLLKWTFNFNLLSRDGAALNGVKETRC